MKIEKEMAKRLEAVIARRFAEVENKFGRVTPSQYEKLEKDAKAEVIREYEKLSKQQNIGIIKA